MYPPGTSLLKIIDSIGAIKKSLHINKTSSRLRAMSETNANTKQVEPSADVMATSTDKHADNEKTLANPTSTTQEISPRHYPVDPYLQDRRDAKAAASDLRCTQQFLESYRLSVLGRSEPDKRIQVSLIPSFHKSVAKFRAIAHPGDRATRAFCSAHQDMQETSRLLHEEYEYSRRARLQAMAHRHGFLTIALPDRSRRIRVG